MTKEEILKRVKKFQGANREFSQELPPIIEGLVDLIDEAGPEVVDNLESNSPTKALSANMGKELKLMVDGKVSEPETAGTAGQILQLDEEGVPEWVDAAEVGATYDSAMSDTSTNAIQNKTIKKYVDDNFAQKDGYYASLTAGAAENLVGRGSVPAEIAFRTSGGDQDLGTGSALITKILGRTEAWNQLVDVSQGSHPEATISSGLITVNATVPAGQNRFEIFGSIAALAGHKYLLSQVVVSGDMTSTITYFAGSVNSITGTGSRIIDVAADASSSAVIMLQNSGGSDAKTFSFSCYILLVDLTLEGLGLTTAEQFRALHPLPYYNYNAGELKNNAATGLETTGFNQWDEEWEKGYYDSNGITGDSAYLIRSINYTKIIPNQTYYIKIPNTTIYICEYDVDKNFISRALSLSSPGTIVFGATTSYIRFCIGTAGAPVTTYNHDICINLSWSGYRNGEYEPYEKHTLNLPLDAIACHDEDNNAVVVNGLDGVGTSQDELIVENGWGTKIIKRRGRRAYQAGDESDATLMTDGTNTDYPLPTPKVLTIDEPFAASYYVNDFGTEARLPQDTADDPQAPFCAEIQYAMNSVDTLRNLPRNYISDNSMENVLNALKTAGIIADFTLTYDSEHQYFTCSVTAPSQGE